MYVCIVLHSLTRYKTEREQLQKNKLADHTIASIWRVYTYPFVPNAFGDDAVQRLLLVNLVLEARQCLLGGKFAFLQEKAPAFIDVFVIGKPSLFRHRNPSNGDHERHDGGE